MSSHLSSKQLDKLGEQIFAKTEKMVLKDYESASAANEQLELVGYRIGSRLIEEYFARTHFQERCSSFRETADAIAKIGLKIFLGISASVKNVVKDPKTHQVKQYSIVFAEYPLMDFVELPPQYRNELWYGNVLAGVIRGCLEVVEFRCSCKFTRCMLRGDEVNEIEVLLKELTSEKPKDDEDD